MGTPHLDPPASFPPTGRAAFVRIALGVVAAAHVLYLGLLITCDVLRVAPRGFVPRFDRGQVIISEVQPGSPAARAGLRNGDRLLRADGKLLRGETDWRRANIHFDPTRPFVVEVERGGRVLVGELRLPAGVGQLWQGNGSSGVLAFRFAQCVTLGFALLVAFRRPFQPSALLGALLLASLATASIVLPMRLGTLWNALPAVAQALLWIPFTISALPGPLLFGFSTVFPGRVWPGSWIAAGLIPAAGLVAWQLHWGTHLIGDVPSPYTARDPVAVVVLVNVLYAAGAVALLMTHQRAAGAVTDRRRIGVLILGTGISAIAALGIIAGYLQNPGVPIFETTRMTVLSLVFLAMPASFAYAILRHRLFDVPLIVRQGLRYALARRSIAALIPALAVLLLLDIMVHREESLATLLEARWWWYLLVGGALLLVRRRREAWLRSVDRKFFRERYDAQRLLASIADQVTHAASLEAAAPSIVRQIDEALHPAFVAVLRHLRAEAIFREEHVQLSSPRGVTLPTSLTVIRVLSVLRKPLAVSLGQTAWVRHQLPAEERTLLLEHGIELLVPVSATAPGELPSALLVLGARRSEEPYSHEDLELLTTIGDAMGALIERSSDDVGGMAECDQCGRCYEGASEVCAADGCSLRRGSGALLINGRYCLERRLGRGGMGVVYAAVDTVLDRAVAVKVIREGQDASRDAAARFRREARAAAALAHPHVVRVYDYGLDRSGHPYLVMELLEGTTLREHVRCRGALPPAEVLHVLRGICSALSAAHARGLVHRDLKPENIFLQSQAAAPVPKILDFGLAKVFNDAPIDSAGTLRTSAGVLVGTLDYMSPEQVAGEDATPGWDLWAVGVMAYEMLTGEHPFRKNILFGYSEISGEAETSRHPTISLLAPNVEAFLSRILSRNCALRPTTADELLANAEQVLA